MRDAWALSLSTLASQADLSQWDGDAVVRTYPNDKESMRISLHVRSVTTDFVCMVLGEVAVGVPFRSDDHIRGSPAETHL